VAPLGDALDKLNTSGTRPIAMDVLNAPAARTIGQDLGLPADWAILAIGFEDNVESVRWQLDRLRTELGKDHGSVLEGAQTTPLWEALTGFQAQELGPIRFRANILPSAVAVFKLEIDPNRWAIQAHVGNGIVHGQGLGEWTREQAFNEITLLRQAAVRAGGNLVLSRCPTEWKESLRVWGEPRADWAIGERVRAALDPHGAINPGRFVT
jgi:glycolate oxidase FAD binding subunit